MSPERSPSTWDWNLACQLSQKQVLFEPNLHTLGGYY